MVFKFWRPEPKRKKEHSKRSKKRCTVLQITVVDEAEVEEEQEAKR